MKEKELSEIEKAENEYRHSVDRRELKKITQCVEHSFRKLTDTEVVCTKCPTVLIVNNADDYAK